MTMRTVTEVTLEFSMWVKKKWSAGQIRTQLCFGNFFFHYCLKEFQFLTAFNYAKEKSNLLVYRCVQVIQKTYLCTVGGIKDLLPQIITVFIKWTVHLVMLLRSLKKIKRLVINEDETS